MAIKKEQTLKQLNEMIIRLSLDDYIIDGYIINDDDDSNITHDYSSNLHLRILDTIFSLISNCLVDWALILCQ